MNQEVNKFIQLENELKGIISKIDSAIKSKESELEDLSLEEAEEKARFSNINKELEILRKKRDILEAVNKKGSIRFLISRFLNDWNSSIEDIAAKYNRFVAMLLNIAMFIVLIIGLLVCAPIFTASPIFGIGLIVFGICAVLLGNAEKFIEVGNIKRKNNQHNFDERIASHESERTSIKVASNNRSNKMSQIRMEIKELQAEKDKYEKALKDVIAYQEQVLKEKATPMLNEAFENFDKSEIIAMIKAREKKEGIE